VKVQDDPDRVTRVTGRDKGTIFHETVERFLRECIHGKQKPAPEHRTAHLARLREIAAEEFKGIEDKGLTGLPVLWEFDRRRLWEDIERWYEHELEDASSYDDAKFEAHFGENEGAIAPPLEIEADGVKLRFNGYIDRLDWKADKSAFRVIDYKTGWRDASLKDGQLKHGEALQLPLYVRAGAEILGLDFSRGSAQYYYSSRRGGFKRTEFTGETLVERGDDLKQVLTILASGIGEGHFQPVPGSSRKNCKWCDYYDLCDARVEVLADRKSADPVSKAFAALEDIE
jgi:hypothetical protein